jgi:hypothetical protein
MPSRPATLAIVLSALMMLGAALSGVASAAVAGTTTVVNCDPGAVAVGQVAHCTVTVTEATAATTAVGGEVEFGANAIGTFGKPDNICELAAAGTGKASCEIDYTPTLLDNGRHGIFATYLGDAEHEESDNHLAPFMLEVSNPTTTAISCGVAPVAAGHASTCTATVTDVAAKPQGVPDGQIKFSSDSPGAFSTGGACTLVRLAEGQSTCDFTYTPGQVGSGSHKISAAYEGENTHKKSQVTAPVAVSDPTVTTLACAPAAISIGSAPAASACTVTVADAAPGLAAPAGQVAFSSDGAGAFSAPACTLDAKGACTVNYTPTAVGSGSHKVTAAYQAVGGHLASAASAVVSVSQPPDTIIGKKPKLKGAPKTAAFTFSSDQSPVSFQCKLDKMAFKPCKSPFNTKTLKTKKVGKKLKPVFKLKKGKHTLQVQAVNAKGVVDPTPATYTWTVGKAPKKHKKH